MPSVFDADFYLEKITLKEILIDYCAYLLLLGEEFRYPVLAYFDLVKKENVHYQNYVNEIDSLINFGNFISETDILQEITDINNYSKLESLITKEEIHNLKDYINSDFDFGFPDDVDEEGLAYGGTFYLELSDTDLKVNYEDFWNLKKIKPQYYVTYYKQFVEHIYRLSYADLKEYKNSIDNFKINENNLGKDTYRELRHNYKNALKNHLLESIQLIPFQLKGSFDDKGFVLNTMKSLVSIIESTDVYSLNKSLDLKVYFSDVRYKYYQIKIDNTELLKNEKEIELAEEFEKLKDDNENQINFLINKGFETDEINIILNLFCYNYFSDLNIRSIDGINNVNYFQAFYLFYRFNFLTEQEKIKFNGEAEFEKVPILNKNSRLDKNMFRKYYSHKDDSIQSYLNPHKDYPFRTLDRFLEKIEKSLLIEKSKLNIPKTHLSI